MRFKRNIEARSENHCLFGKSIYITYSDSVFMDLGIQYVNACAVLYCHPRRIVLSSVAFQAVPYFSTLSDTRHEFRENIIEYRMCVLTCPKNFRLK
jgi:hypothetical protein